MTKIAPQWKLRKIMRGLSALGLALGALVAAPGRPARAQPLPAPAVAAGPPGGYIHMSDAANLSGDSTYLDSLRLNGDANAGFLAINHLDPYDVLAVSNNHPPGIWYNSIK